MHNVWFATSRNSQKKHDVIQASAFWHGQRKARATRLCTSILQAMKPNKFAYETDSCLMSCWPHEDAPAPLLEGATTAAQVHHTYKLFHSTIYQLTRGQGGPGWMAARLFRFTSTTFHTLVNVRSASYFNTPQLRQLHADAKIIIQLEPVTDITHDNVTDMEDETLPSQRSGLCAVLSTKKQRSKHSNCTPEYCKKRCDNKQQLVAKCIEHGIDKLGK